MRSLCEVHVRTTENWITAPTPIAPDVIRSLPPTQRFGIREQHGNGPGKLRLADDYKISGINDALGMLETSRPDSIDVALAMGSTPGLSRGQTSLEMIAKDFSRAHKHIGIDVLQGRFP